MGPLGLLFIVACGEIGGTNIRNFNIRWQKGILSSLRVTDTF